MELSGTCHVSWRQMTSGLESKSGNSVKSSENSLNFAGRLWMFSDITMNLDESKFFNFSASV